MTVRAPKVAGLIGWPVAQSKSPLIHRFWLERLGIDGHYGLYPVMPGDAGAALRAMVPLGFTGLQATMPHKRDCFAAVDELTDAARALGAVNTVSVTEGGRLCGHNTDLAGFLEPLVGIDLAGTNVTVLGAGGAAAAVTVGLASKRPARIRLVNRSREALDRLLADIAESLSGITVSCHGFDDFPVLLGDTALLANATSMGMAGYPPCPADPAQLPRDAIVYDIVTHPRETPLLVAAMASGLRTFDGMHMLVGQAREAFSLFFGAVPDPGDDATLRRMLTQ